MSKAQSVVILAIEKMNIVTLQLVCPRYMSPCHIVALFLVVAYLTVVFWQLQRQMRGHESSDDSGGTDSDTDIDTGYVLSFR